MKTLVVYYSYEGNTKELVDYIKSIKQVDTLQLKVIDEKPTKSMFRFVWGGMQVYMKKKPHLEKYEVDLNTYENIIIATPCWFGSYAPAIHTFISENKIEDKNIYLLVSNGGNLRHTFDDFKKALKGNRIVGTLDLVYPKKNGIEKAKEEVKKWLERLQ